MYIKTVGNIANKGEESKSCGYPITKSSNWIRVIEHPYDAHRLCGKWACREPITINNFVIDMFIKHTIPDSKFIFSLHANSSSGTPCWLI